MNTRKPTDGVTSVAHPSLGEVRRLDLADVRGPGEGR